MHTHTHARTHAHTQQTDSHTRPCNCTGQLTHPPTRHPRSLGKHTHTTQHMHGDWCRTRHAHSLTDTPLIQIHWCINERIQRSLFWSTVERLSTYLCKVQNVFDRRAARTVGHVNRYPRLKTDSDSSVPNYNFIAKCQYNCTRNVLWCQVHSSHIHSNHETLNYNKSKQVIHKQIHEKSSWHQAVHIT